MSRGVAELESGAEPLGRARRPGGGRKRVADLDPGLRPALLALVEPDERGDPMSPLRWTTKSTAGAGGRADPARGTGSAPTRSPTCCARRASACRATPRRIEGRQHPDRDAQFRYINEQVKAHHGSRRPGGQRGHQEEGTGRGRSRTAAGSGGPAGEPVRVRTHDFPDPELGKAIPYGIYDLAANTGWVNVGTDHDTAAFAVESIRRWWHGGRARPPTRAPGGC